MLSILSQVVDLIYPPICHHCDAELKSQDDMICYSCAESLPYLSSLHANVHDVVSRRMNNLVPLTHQYACFFSSENNIVQSIIKSFKYHKDIQAGEFMSRLMAIDFMQFTQDNLATFDAIIPVPIHRQKKMKRGYNQSEIIAQAIAHELSIPVVKNVLSKVMSSVSQTQKSRYLRMHLREEMFAVHYREEMKKHHFLIVDDIITTGATIEKCVNNLRKEYPEAQFSIAALALSEY